MWIMHKSKLVKVYHLGLKGHSLKDWYNFIPINLNECKTCQIFYNLIT